MQLEDTYIIKWKLIHYDALDYCYKYDMTDSINIMSNINIWTKNGINYLDKFE